MRRVLRVFAVVLAVGLGATLGLRLNRSEPAPVAAGDDDPFVVATRDPTPAPTPEPLAGTVARPARGTAYWGAYRDGAPYARTLVTTLEKSAASTPAILMWYQEWDGEQPFPERDVAWLRSRGIVPMISWEPWKPPRTFGDLVVEQPRYRLARIADGAFDEYIARYALAIRRYGGPVMLRPFHEMDGFWYPWGGTVNGNTPEDFRRAWRHVHGIFRRIGATNVTWVWSVNHLSVPKTPENSPGRYWPGKGYVDWIGISGFNWGNASTVSVWKGFTSVIWDRYREMLRYQKPIALTETAAPERGGNKAAWIRDAYSVIATKFPSLSAIIWYDKRDSASRDWRITSSARALAAFRAAVARPNVISADAALRTTRR